MHHKNQRCKDESNLYNFKKPLKVIFLLKAVKAKLDFSPEQVPIFPIAGHLVAGSFKTQIQQTGNIWRSSHEYICMHFHAKVKL